MTMMFNRIMTGVHSWPPSISFYRAAVCNLNLYHIIFNFKVYQQKYYSRICHSLSSAHLLHQEWNKKQPTDRIRCHALPELYPVASSYCKRSCMFLLIYTPWYLFYRRMMKKGERSLLFSWGHPTSCNPTLRGAKKMGAALLCIAHSPIVASCNQCI